MNQFVLQILDKEISKTHGVNKPVYLKNIFNVPGPALTLLIKEVQVTSTKIDALTVQGSADFAAGFAHCASLLLKCNLQPVRKR